MFAESGILDLINTAMMDSEYDYSNFLDILIKKNYLIKTDDGTYTIRSEQESELMHSRVGALTEALHKFALPSDIASLKSPTVLDLCSGLGYNTLAAMIQNKKSLIDMVEISREILFLGQFLKLPYIEHDELKKILSDYFKDIENERIKIYCDDARKFIQTKPDNYYNVVFHDGFSPSNDPVLYTVDFLQFLYKKMNTDSILLSYSSSIPFRSGLIEAGFFIGEGPSIGRFRGITMASKIENDYRITRRLSIFDEQLIALSTIGKPFYDRGLNKKSLDIQKKRDAEREILKTEKKYISTKKIKKNRIDEKYSEIQIQAENSRSSILAMREYHLSQSPESITKETIN